MRFTATSKYNAIAKGAAKIVKWTIAYRKVTALNTSLSSGTWTDITTRIPDFHGVSHSLEFTMGQFTADAIVLSGVGIDYFQAGPFSLSATEYCEIRITCQIGLSDSNLASDIVYAFYGFADTRTPGGLTYDERRDRVTFRVSTPEEIAGRLSAENLTTKYVKLDADGTNDGLILVGIPGMWVTDANIASKVLQVGTHTIDYRDNGGTDQARLDGGDWVTLTGPTSGSATLKNIGDTQRVTIYYLNADLPASSASEKIIVKTAGDTLPYCWYAYQWIRDILVSTYASIGLDTVNSDALQIATYDGTRKISFMDVPPKDLSVEGLRSAIELNSTASLMWVGVGGKLYERNMTTHVYTLLGTCDSTATASIFRIIYNSRNDQVWAFYEKTSGGNLFARQYKRGTSTLSAEISVGETLTHATAIQLFDYNYTGSTYEYCILVSTDLNSRIMRIDGVTLAVTTLFDLTGGTGTQLRYDGANPYSTAVIEGAAIKRDSDKFYFFVDESSAIIAGTYLHYIQFEDPGGGWAWYDKFSPYTITGDPDPPDMQCVYEAWNDVWLYWLSTDGKLRSLTFSANTETDRVTGITTLGSLYSDVDSSLNIYFTDVDAGELHELTNAWTHNILDDGVYSKSGFLPYQTQMIWAKSGDIYGIDVSRLDNGRIYRCDNILEIYIDQLDFTDKSTQEALNEILNAFFLIGKISSKKEAFVYRRGDTSGNPVTTGNSLTLTANEVENYTLDNLRFRKFALVKVSNGTTTWSYDGTTWNSSVLTDARTFTLESSYIPDKLVRHLAYHIYQYLKTDRNGFDLDLGAVPLFQYEPTDGLSLSLSGTKIGGSGSGIITHTQLRRDGSMTVKGVI